MGREGHSVALVVPLGGLVDRPIFDPRTTHDLHDSSLTSVIFLHRATPSRLC